MNANQKKITLILFTVGLVVFIMLWYIYSNIGAGVIGNIGKYNIDATKENVLDCIEQTNSKNLYGLCEGYGYNIEGSGYEDDFIFLRTELNQEKYLFMIKIIDSKESGVDCYLISAARYCSVMKNSRKMNMFERYRYRKVFQNGFLVLCPWSWTPAPRMFPASAPRSRENDR